MTEEKRGRGMHPNSLKNLTRKGKGRPKGSENRLKLEHKEFLEQTLGDPEYQEKLKKRLYAGKLAPGMEALLWNYWKGKPAETVKMEVEAKRPPISVTVLPEAGEMAIGALHAAQSNDEEQES